MSSLLMNHPFLLYFSHHQPVDKKERKKLLMYDHPHLDNFCQMMMR